MIDMVLLFKLYRPYIKAAGCLFVVFILWMAYLTFKTPDFSQAGLYALSQKEAAALMSIPQVETFKNSPIILILPSKEAIRCPNGEAIIREVRTKVYPWESTGIVNVVQIPTSLVFDKEEQQKAFLKYISVISLYVPSTQQYFVPDVNQAPRQVAQDVVSFLERVYPLSE